MTGLSLISRPSPNFDDRPAGEKTDMLVFHYTGMQSADAAIERLRDREAKVSSHYLIDEEGAVYALVDEDRRAWHAGLSRWLSHSDVNSRSIGIELVNPGHEFGYRPFPEAQMNALAVLSLDILSRHAIPPGNVVGHSDIAPSRKQDPGELFDWAWLASLGIGLWPEKSERGGAIDPKSVSVMLGRYGYDLSQPPAVLVSAFQRHFRPELCDGRIDQETLRRLASLLEQAGR